MPAKGRRQEVSSAARSDGTRGNGAGECSSAGCRGSGMQTGGHTVGRFWSSDWAIRGSSTSGRRTMRGFLAIDRLAQRTGAVVSNRRCRALTGTTRIAGRDVVLAKPETFMNLSGLSVRGAGGGVRCRSAEPAGFVRRAGASARHAAGAIRGGLPAATNGAASINGALGTEEWARIRIGVGPDGVGDGHRGGGRITC